jgi:hypothetical protein
MKILHFIQNLKEGSLAQTFHKPAISLNKHEQAKKSEKAGIA